MHSCAAYRLVRSRHMVGWRASMRLCHGSRKLQRIGMAHERAESSMLIGGRLDGWSRTSAGALGSWTGLGCTFHPYRSGRPKCLKLPSPNSRAPLNANLTASSTNSPAANTAKPPSHTPGPIYTPTVACTYLPVIFRTTFSFLRQTTSHN